ncbi:putative membrane protein [Leeuwenhoekiella aestuarii]|uniref:Putative membrane protein n=1 Tax=Leeuwenhoekiella aestuarii TaxID=2249426 RepID=A0A4Q0NTZ8_9FLAO|nr:SHOCT domain-containing protein [Leeuwenhoekiella aestuarii]RXG11638.1 putative membrane protein [Leeuwenhoekiella aestuarii]RXG15151.1 putative membrane protein [Leeuwenhoekiella aestuarii]
MHVIWWFIWGILLLWMFATPYEIPGQFTRKETPLDILKRRFAYGEINMTEYKKLKEHLR